MEDCEELSQLNITPDLFNILRSFRDFQNILNDLDISDEDQLDLFDTLDVDGGGTIDLEELIVGISKLRGDARRSDIVGVSLIARNIQSAVTRLQDITMQLHEDQTHVLKACRDWTRSTRKTGATDHAYSRKTAGVEYERQTMRHAVGDDFPKQRGNGS